jgi:hypothetical protein
MDNVRSSASTVRRKLDAEFRQRHARALAVSSAAGFGTRRKRTNEGRHLI